MCFFECVCVCVCVSVPGRRALVYMWVCIIFESCLPGWKAALGSHVAVRSCPLSNEEACQVTSETRLAPFLGSVGGAGITGPSLDASPAP